MSQQSCNQYRQNHLLCQLRAASLDREDHVFARTGDDSRVVSYRQLFDGVEQVAATPLLEVACTPDFKTATHRKSPSRT